MEPRAYLFKITLISVVEKYNNGALLLVNTGLYGELVMRLEVPNYC